MGPLTVGRRPERVLKRGTLERGKGSAQGRTREDRFLGLHVGGEVIHIIYFLVDEYSTSAPFLFCPCGLKLKNSFFDNPVAAPPE